MQSQSTRIVRMVKVAGSREDASDEQSRVRRRIRARLAGVGAAVGAVSALPVAALEIPHAKALGKVDHLIAEADSILAEADHLIAPGLDRVGPRTKLPRVPSRFSYVAPRVAKAALIPPLVGGAAGALVGLAGASVANRSLGRSSQVGKPTRLRRRKPS